MTIMTIIPIDFFTLPKQNHVIYSIVIPEIYCQPAQYSLFTGIPTIAIEGLFFSVLFCASFSFNRASNIENAPSSFSPYFEEFSPFSLFSLSLSFSSFSFAVLAFHSFQFRKYSLYWHRTHKTSVRVKKTIRQSMPCTVAHSTRRYIGTALGPLHPGLHRNGAQRGSVFTFLSVVCCLYVTFLLPLERAPKVLAPSLFNQTVKVYPLFLD